MVSSGVHPHRLREPSAVSLPGPSKVTRPLSNIFVLFCCRLWESLVSVGWFVVIPVISLLSFSISHV